MRSGQINGDPGAVCLHLHSLGDTHALRSRESTAKGVRQEQHGPRARAARAARGGARHAPPRARSLLPPSPSPRAPSLLARGL